MGKSSPSPPPAPDPVKTAQAQTEMNVETAIAQAMLNNVNQVTPWGSVTYNQIPGTGPQFDQAGYDAALEAYQAGVAQGLPQGSPQGPFGGQLAELVGRGATGRPGGLGRRMNWGGITAPNPNDFMIPGAGVPRFEAVTELSPEQQAIFDQTQDAQFNLASLASQQSSQLNDVLSSPFEYTNRDAELWAYDLASPRLLEQQGQNESALRTRLINAGIRPGTSAWDSEMSRMTQSNTDQLNQLALMGRSQGYNEARDQYTLPVNVVSALLSGSQVTNPASTVANTAQTGVAGVDYAGLVNQNYANQMNAYNQGQANQAAGLGGLFGLGGSLLGAAGQAGGFAALFSDIRLKRDITRVGTTDGGLPVYTYRYVTGGPMMMGVMAHDVEKVIPDAVMTHDSGFKMVDYGKVM